MKNDLVSSTFKYETTKLTSHDKFLIIFSHKSNNSEKFDPLR